MVLNGFDSLKALKPISMGNYSRRRKLKWLFEFFLFLFLVSCRSSFFSFAGPVLLHLFRRLVVALNSHIFVFMFFHAMLFVVYSLSGLTETKSGSNRNEVEPGPAAVEEGRVSPESSVVPRDDSVAEILDVGDENTVSSPSVGSPVRHLNSVTETAEEITPEMKRYRRTESERFEGGDQERGKFRRSKTEIGREIGDERARNLRSVDEMNMDDFNRTVESFIAEQKLHIGGRSSG